MGTFSIELDGENVDVAKLWQCAQAGLDPAARLEIRIAPAARKRIEVAAKFVEEIRRRGKPVYGVNTGFGNFAEVAIDSEKLDLLQRNLIVSHCCGVGEPLTRDIVLAMWLIRLNTICRGNSGVRPSTVDFVVRSLEAGLLAEVPSRGSVGASGDLAPSAHATLALLGEGKASIARGDAFVTLSSAEALRALSLEPIKLGPKEGLSLINGTQLTTALAIKAWWQGNLLLRSANLAAAMSVEGLRGSRAIVNEGVLVSRRHPGPWLAVAKCKPGWASTRKFRKAT